MRRCVIIFVLLGFVFIMNQSYAKAKVKLGKEQPLWPEGVKDSNGLSGPEKGGKCISNISTPTYTVYLPPKKIATGAAVVLISGGGYGAVCTGTEGNYFAKIFVKWGVAAIVLKYRLPNKHHEIPANDARQAIRTVRAYAKQWNINPNMVGVWGGSAGGHLASTVSTVFDSGSPKSEDPIAQQSSRPDFSILYYPVISMSKEFTHMGSRRNLLGNDPDKKTVKRYSNELQVTTETPPTFLLHCSDDKVVNVENSVGYYRSLIKNKVKAQCLIYEKGGHGPRSWINNPSSTESLKEWMILRGCVKK